MTRATPADITEIVANALSAITSFLGHFSAFDWILAGVAVALILYAWMRAASFVRLGTITIADLNSDGSTTAPNELRADLQKKLGDRGLLPPSGVPGGSPTKESLSAAVAAAPVPQAAWLAALINLLPIPPTSTSFALSGTLSATLGGTAQPCGLYCELECQGPQRSVKLLAPRGSDWPVAIDTAAKDVYRAIAEAAPAIFPRWAQWASNEALTVFAEGLMTELGDPAAPSGVPATRLARYISAYERYRHASDLDPDNMLARIRTANMLEQCANELADAAQRSKMLEALEAYVSIRLRQPMIFEAGYRAAVLLSRLAQDLPDSRRELERLGVVLGRLDLEYADRISASTWRRFVTRARRPTRALSAFLRAGAQDPAEEQRRLLVSRMERTARIESRLARRRLLPWWTMMREGRFRHRFEPTGQTRRQLRKALGISQMCIRARRARDAQGLRAEAVSDLTQLVWRGWVFWRYIAGRSNVAGWQAHYNAACFYALLPGASDEKALLGGARLRVKALRHLARAFDQSGGELQCRYVRDDDPDLATLRTLSKHRFRQVLGSVCPDELIVHFPDLEKDSSWTLHVWGDAIAPSTQPTWTTPVLPSRHQTGEPVFRVRIFDENKPLAVLAHCGDQKARPVWALNPVLDTSEDRLADRWTFIPVNVNYEVWLYPQNPNVYKHPQ